MTRIRFEDLPSTNTPRNAENLNKLNNVIISPTEPTTGEEVWIQKGKNLFNKDSVQKGYVYGADGTLTANALWNASEFIKVNPNTPYTVQSTQISGKIERQITLSYWDINRTWIGEKYTINLVETITTPNNCAYITVSHRNDTQENIQLEQGSTATTYEPYIDKKIYTKNDNGVYEEFYNENYIFQEIENKVGYKSYFTEGAGNTNDITFKVGDVAIVTTTYKSGAWKPMILLVCALGSSLQVNVLGTTSDIFSYTTNDLTLSTKNNYDGANYTTVMIINK